MDPLAEPADPWLLELVVVRDGSHDGGERRALSRDVERGLLTRVVAGAYVERTGFEALSPEGRHIVVMRAVTATSDRPPVHSHWSAAVLFGLPVLHARLGTVHVTVDRAGSRGRRGVSGHVFPLRPDEVLKIGGLLVTTAPRTVIDVAGSGTFAEGVMVADRTLHDGFARDALERAIDVAGPRNASARMRRVVSFAAPGSDSALESRGRTTMRRLGVEPPVLQHRIALRGGRSAFLDFSLERAHVGVEGDGKVKLLDPRLSPAEAKWALVQEKRREDELRLGLRGLGRFGWEASLSTRLLGGILARVGIDLHGPRATVADYCARAAEGRARFVPRRPTVLP